jgi:hypothetical protein
MSQGQHRTRGMPSRLGYSYEVLSFRTRVMVGRRLRLQPARYNICYDNINDVLPLPKGLELRKENIWEFHVGADLPAKRVLTRTTTKACTTKDRRQETGRKKVV